MQILTITAIGFLSAFSGALMGIFLAAISRKLGRRSEGAITGFTAGILLSFVCFGILKEGFEAAPLHIGVIGILMGVLAAAGLEIALPEAKSGTPNVSMIAAAGVALHHFPEGLAFGALCATSMSKGVMLAVLSAFHCIPETAAVFIPLKETKRSHLISIAYAAALSAPMALGSLAGFYITGFSSVFQSLSLTFSGGVMLYIACAEMLPNSIRIWSRRITMISAVCGFILGVVITA